MVTTDEEVRTEEPVIRWRAPTTRRSWTNVGPTATGQLHWSPSVTVVQPVGRVPPAVLSSHCTGNSGPSWTVLDQAPSSKYNLGLKRLDEDYEDSISLRRCLTWTFSEPNLHSVFFLFYFHSLTDLTTPHLQSSLFLEADWLLVWGPVPDATTLRLCQFPLSLCSSSSPELRLLSVIIDDNRVSGFWLIARWNTVLLKSSAKRGGVKVSFWGYFYPSCEGAVKFNNWRSVASTTKGSAVVWFKGDRTKNELLDVFVWRRY